MQTGSFFNFDDFKKWMNNQEDKSSSRKNKKNTFEGISVESKVGVSKLVSKIQESDVSVYEIAKDFFENGGVIVESEDKNFLIQTDLGNFSIHRSYIRRS